VISSSYFESEGLPKTGYPYLTGFAQSVFYFVVYISVCVICQRACSEVTQVDLVGFVCKGP
jgi:hypothetical protein